MRNAIALPVLFVFILGACKKENSIQTSIINTTDLAVNIEENPDSGQVLGAIIASSDRGAVSYALSSESVADAFTVNTTSGEISVADKYLFDFETSPVMSAIIAISDGISNVNANVTIYLTDLEHIWTGPKTIFFKSAYANPELESNQDRITENVWLTRGNSGTLINALGGKDCSPARVKMAYGTVAELSSLTFYDCMEKLEESQLKELPGKDLVFYLTADDIYIDVHFITWSSGANGGEFSYERSTP